MLRPDEETTAAFEFCFGEAAKRFGIEVHSFLAMSNHYHAVVTDPRGVLPKFLEHVHKMVAKALNVRWSRWENFWAAEECCSTDLITDEDVFAKVVYTLANPVAAHLVDRAILWPGASSLSLLDGGKKTVKRPWRFFSKKGTMPESVTLETTVPAGQGDRVAWAARVRAAIAVVEQRATDERARTGRKIVGRKEVLRRSAFASPETHEPRRKLRPALACCDVVRRGQELANLVLFRARYRESWLAFSTGLWDTVFPEGTWGMRRFPVRCESPEPAFQ